jgi:vancomycin resistance protein YoaR
MIVFILLAVVINVGILYAYHSRTTAEGVFFDGVEVGGMRMSEVSTVVKDIIAKYEVTPFQLSVNGKKLFVSSSDMGVQYDYRRSVRSVFDIGTRWSAFEAHAAAKGEKRYNLKPVYTFNEAVMNDELREILSARSLLPQDAQLVWQAEAGWSISPEQNGRTFSEEEIARLARLMEGEMVNRLDRRLLTAEFQPLVPEQKAEDIEPLLEKVLAFVDEPVKVAVGGVEHEMDLSSLKDMIVYDYETGTVGASAEAIEKWAEYLALELYEAPGEVTITGTTEYESDYDGNTVYQIVFDGEVFPGRKIDHDLLGQRLREVFAKNEERYVDLEFEVVPPSVVSDVSDLEFPDLLGVGRSSYRLGNYPNRVHNIHQGLSMINGTLIYPGEEFSFDRTTGWITYEKGFQKGQAIAGDSLIDVAGGGICQVSTTVYRAALDSGMEITERRPHSWYVSYYTDYGDGLDATIYPPGPKGNNDFKFAYNADPYDIRFVQQQNDSQYILSASVLDKEIVPEVVPIQEEKYPLLVLAAPDVKAEEAIVWIFGHSDGRQVSLEQVDETHVGKARTRTWIRRIVMGDEVKEEEIFSRYRR